MSFDVEAVRAQFPILKREFNGKLLVYLDSAATTLKPQSVVERVAQHYLMESSNVHRGVHTLSDLATTEFENAREVVRKFVGASSKDQIVFTHGTTESINIVARGLDGIVTDADEIVITELEHHSNMVPWQMLAQRTGAKLKYVEVTADGELPLQAFEKAITDKTKILAVTGLSNSLGTVPHLTSIIKHARSKGALTLVDAAQLISNQKINIETLDCDYLVFSAHKLFGPTGVGVLCGNIESLNLLSPLFGGGAMIEKVEFDKSTYLEAPFRFEAGTPHIAGVIGMAKAIEFVTTLGIESIFEHERELTKYGIEKLQSVEGLKWLGPLENRGPILSFNIDGVHHQDLGSLLNEEAVAIRTGHHCTQPILRKLGYSGSCRASLSIYNTKQDIDRLVDATNKALRILR